MIKAAARQIIQDSDVKMAGAYHDGVQRMKAAAAHGRKIIEGTVGGHAQQVSEDLLKDM